MGNTFPSVSKTLPHGLTRAATMLTVLDMCREMLSCHVPRGAHGVLPDVRPVGPVLGRVGLDVSPVCGTVITTKHPDTRIGEGTIFTRTSILWRPPVLTVHTLP